LSDVSLAQSDSLADFGSLPARNVHRQDGLQVRSLGESVLRVVHDGVVVVSLAERIHILFRQLIEVVLLTGHDVDLVDHNVILTIRSRVLVPKAHNMSQLVNHNAKLIAIFANGNRLWTLTSLADKGATSCRKWKIF
jgi:hypothetical protein